MNGVAFTPLRRIAVPKGDVLHAIKATDDSYAGFGEAYFSMVDAGAVKGWKRHRRMVMNLVVPMGAVRFVACDRDAGAETFESFVLSPDAPETYGRLTVQPGLWLAFQGLARPSSLILNFASIVHDPHEADNLPLEAIPWAWPEARDPVA
jgi:dTDP-4-dehydrorhamnose 3,5-epimerase